MTADRDAGGSRARAWGFARRACRAVGSYTARVGVRLTAAFVAVALLIPLVGWVAIGEQYAASARAARIEAVHVAEQVALFATHTDPGRASLYQQPDGLQTYVIGLRDEQGRDIEIVDADLRILADAIPQHRGEVFTGDNGEVAATMRDGAQRTFIETSSDFPHGIQVVVVPMRSSGRIVGAVLLEYTPIYDTLVDAGANTRRIIIAVSLAGTVTAIGLGLALSRGIVRDLRQLRQVAGQLAAGDDDARARVNAAGEIGDLAVTFNDMADQIVAQKATLSDIAGTDPLTGLDNRRTFLTRLRTMLTAARRDGNPAALLMLDVDHFKNINDSHGHAAGDTALQTLAGLLQTAAAAGASTARLGGEEFAVLLPDTGREQALDAAERLRASIAAVTVMFRGRRLRLTASIGVVCYPLHATTVDGLLHAADNALYAAKHAGRDRVSEPPHPPIVDHPAPA